MSFNTNDLKELYTNKLLLRGVAKGNVASLTDSIIKVGKMAFWGAHNWTFARKYGTISVTANNSTGVSLPNDCEAVITMSRLTTSDDGFPITLLTEATFDENFPYLAEVPTDDPVWAKVVFDNGTLKAYFAPLTKSTFTCGIAFKMKYTDTVFENCVPVDQLGNVLIFIDYYGLSSVYAGDGRPLSLNPDVLDYHLRDAIKKDRVHHSTANLAPSGMPLPVDRTSADFALRRGRYEVD